MGICSLGQTMEFNLRRTHSTRLIQFDNTFEVAPPASHGRSQRRYIGALWFWRLRARSDEGRATASLEHCKGSLRHVAPHRVENGVAISDCLCEIASVVVDDFIGAEAAHIGMVRRTRSGDHVGADMLGKLNGKAGDAARPSLN